jgi:(p)ppGpp synthase/HD superfamily hydrolase
VKALGPRFRDAVSWAHELHGQQARKGSDIPYVSHLLAVTALVLEDGGDEDEAIAALLHDSVEDTEATVTEVERRFGPRVASIVAGCTDTDEKPKPAWRPRKEAYLRGLRGATPSVRRVSLADKLHNARSLLTDHRRLGNQLWECFNAGAEEQLWYYHSLVDEFRGEGPMADELARVVDQLASAVGTLADLPEGVAKSGA